MGLCETFLTSKVGCGFPGYHSMIRLDRPGDIGRGGLAFLVRKDIIFSKHNLNIYHTPSLEIVSIQIRFPFGWVPISICYNPHRDISTEEFQFYFDQFPQNSIVMGDFNAHHPLWGTPKRSRLSNPTGISLYNFLTNSINHSLLTPKGLPTYFDRRHGTYSTIDLTIGSGRFCHINEIKSGPGIGSDHFPIIHSYNVSPSTETLYGRNKWNFKNVDWAKYKMAVSELVIDNENSRFPENVTTFTENIISAGKMVASFGPSKKSFKHNRAFWDQECSRTVANRRKAQRKFAKFPNVENKISYSKHTAISKRLIKKKKKESWQNFTKSLSFSTPSKKVWQFFGNLQGKSISTNYPIEKDGLPLSSNLEKAQHLADYFSNIFNTPNDHDDLLTNISAAKVLSSKEPYNCNLTINELQYSIQKLKKDSAIGTDFIHNQLIINLPSSVYKYLLKIFNDSWNKSIIPSLWKEANVLPFLKSNKPGNILSSYRPISLLSCLGKLVERMICNRLSWFLENKNLLPSNQFGFRKRRSTLEPLIILEHNIQKTLRTKKVLIAVFFDVEKAFDRASRIAILTKMLNLGIRGRMFSWIDDYLSSRTFKVTVGSSSSNSFPSTSGVPQGSILSPTLYTILLSDFKVNKDIVDLYYADDTTFFVVDTDIDKAVNKMQAALITYQAWCNCWGIKINSNKTAFMCFTRKRIQRIPVLKYNEIPIKLTKNHKFLGLILDAPLLTWKGHINQLKETCTKRLNIMRCLAGTSWGSSREILLKFYNAYIQSILNYGQILYASSSPSLRQSLEVVRNTGLRIATGARKSTPIMSLLVESSFMSTRYQSHYNATKFYAKCTQLSNSHPIAKILREAQNLLNCINWVSFPHKMPFFLRTQLNSYTSLSIHPPDFNPISSVSPIPPWISFEQTVSKSFLNWEKSFSNAQTVSLFSSLLEDSYKNHFHIYTDGSHFSDPPATGAAFLLFELGSSFSYRIDHIHSPLSAELFAIKKSLCWIESNINIIKKPIVIFTDSLVSLHLITSPDPSSYRSITYYIKEKISSLLNIIDIHIQWIPAHSGIWGNELVDILAKQSCSSVEITPYSISLCDLAAASKSAAKRLWSAEWELLSEQTWLGVSRPKINRYPWFSHPNRAADVAMTRIRLGHTGLAASLYRFGIVDSPLCSICQENDDINHFILYCPRNQRARNQLMNGLSKFGILNLTIDTLLMNDQSTNFSDIIKKTITRLFASFILATGRVAEI